MRVYIKAIIKKQAHFHLSLLSHFLSLFLIKLQITWVFCGKWHKSLFLFLRVFFGGKGGFYFFSFMFMSSFTCKSLNM